MLRGVQTICRIDIHSPLMGVQALRDQSKLLSPYFTGFCKEAHIPLPIRAKYCKKHRQVVAKFDHYCYALGNSIGELNHGQFYRTLAVQVRQDFYIRAKHTGLGGIPKPVGGC